MTDVKSCSQTQPLAEWVRGRPRNPDVCRSCLLTSLAIGYQQELESQGQAEVAKKFLAYLEGRRITPVGVARRMDQIKTQVPDAVARSLQSLDCDLQVNE